MNSRRLAAVGRRVAADRYEVGEDLLARATVGVAHERGVAARRRPTSGAGRARAASSAGRVTGGGAVRGDGEAGPLEELDEQVDLLGARAPRSGDRGRRGPR